MLIVAGVALRVISLFLVADPEASQFSDMRYYADVGEKIHQGQKLDDYETYYMPLGLSYACAGVHRLGLDPLITVPLLHIALDMLSCLLIARLAALLVSDRVGLWALGAACLYPPFVIQSGFLLTETTYMFLGLGAYCAYALVAKRGRHPWLLGLLCGLSFTLALMFKSNLWLMPLVVAVAAAIWRPVRVPWRFVAGFALGWVAITGVSWRPSELSVLESANKAASNSAINLYLGRTYARYIVTSDHERSRWVHNTAPALYFKNKNEPIVVNHSPLDGVFFVRQTMDYVGEHKITLVTYTAEHVLDLLGLVPYWPLVETRLAPLDPPLRIAIGLLVILPAMLALGIRREPQDRILLVLPLVMILIVSMVFFGSPRYRLPFDGYLLILALTWFDRIRSRLESRPACSPPAI
jgi:4-amino-4-deoxy-L-arabinose transferase-like glycosyltransferase